MNQQSQAQSQTLHSVQDITSWIKGVKDPTTLSTIAREVFGQIDTLDSGQRDQVYSQLRNDARFNNSMSNFSPQTA